MGSLKFRNIQRKTSVLESLFNKVVAQMFSCEYCGIFKNTYFEEHLGTAVSAGSVTVNS